MLSDSNKRQPNPEQETPRTNPAEQARRFNEWANESGIIDAPPENNERPLIKIPTDRRELIDFCEECAVELAKEDRLFRRDRLVMAVNHEEARLDIMTPRAMCSFAQQFIKFFKLKVTENDDGEKETEVVVKNIATETAAKLLESWQLLKKLPNIRRVNPTRLPVFRGDGHTDLLRPGYFAEQGIYTVDDGVQYDETMTREQACAVLDDLLKYFPFLNERSKACAIAAMFTMFCATMLSRKALRPGNLYIANAPGAGKRCSQNARSCPWLDRVSYERCRDSQGARFSRARCQHLRALR